MKKILALLLVAVMCLSLCACGEEEKEIVSIEITMDNWQDYFEIALVADIGRNDFNEVVTFQPRWRFCLKEQYAEAVTAVDVAVEYSCSDGYFCTYTYNIDTGEITIGEPDVNDPAEDITKTFALDNLLRQGFITTYVRGGIDYTVIEGNTATIVASKYENIDILRVQGSITITE